MPSLGTHYPISRIEYDPSVRLCRVPQTESGCGPLWMQGRARIPVRDFLCSGSRLSRGGTVPNQRLRTRQPAEQVHDKWAGRRLARRGRP